MKKSKTLKRAEVLLIRKKYKKVTFLLENKISLFINNEEFFYLLSRAYLNLGDIENAELYAKKSEKINPSYFDVKFIIVYISLFNNNISEAVKILLEILNQEPNNKIAKYSLDKIRKLSDFESIYLFMKKKGYSKLLPKVSGYYLFYLKKFILFSFLSFFLLFGTYEIYSNRVFLKSFIMKKVFFLKEERKGSKQIEIVNNKSIVDIEPHSRFTLTEKEIKKTFKRIKKNYNAYNDNLVRLDINRIILSNATKTIQNKALAIGDLLLKPEINKLRNNFAYKEVVSNPLLYNNCYVIWKGKATNIHLDNNNGHISFDFLVGYIDGKLLEGTVFTKLSFWISINPNEPIELLGKIYIEDDKKVRLEGLTVRLLTVDN